MVDKAKMKKVMRQFTPKRANIAQITGSDPLELPNFSKGKAPESDKDLANKKYVDDQIAGVGIPKLNEVENPDGNKTFTMSNKLLAFRYTAPTPADEFEGAFEIEASGGFTGNLLHVHQHTGNPGEVHMVHLEAEDADVLPLCSIHASGRQLQLANISESKFCNFTVDASHDLTMDPSSTGKVIINSELDVAGTIFADGPVIGLDVLRSAEIAINLDVGQDLDVTRNITVGGTAGIGTATPTTDLEVSTAGANGIDISEDGNNAVQSGRLFFSNATAGTAFVIWRTGDELRFNSGATAGSATGSTKMTIEEGGDVGIGVTDPTRRLSVFDASEELLRLSQSGVGSWDIGVTDEDAFGIWDQSVADPYFVVEAGGNVGIGIRNPAGSLHIKRTTDAEPHIILEQTEGTGIDWTLSSLDNGEFRLTDTDNSVSPLRVEVASPTSTLILDSVGRINSLRGRVPAGTIHGATITQDAIFHALDSSIPNTNDEIIISGGADIGTTGPIVFSRAVRSGGSSIALYYWGDGLGGSMSVIDGTMTTVAISLAW